MLGFDARAATWDDAGRVKRAELISGEIRKRLCGKRYAKALEFGCGTGLVSYGLRDCFDSITLIDISAGMIDVLNGKIAESGVDNMNAYRMDILGPEGDGLGIGTFDTVYASMAMHHVREAGAVIGRFHSVLREGGMLCIVDLDKDDGRFHADEEGFDGHHGFDQEWLRGLFETAGFTDVRSETFFRGVKSTSAGDIDYSLFIMTGRR